MLKRLSLYFVKKYRNSTVPQWYILILDTLIFIAAFVLMEAFRISDLSEVYVRGLIVKFVISLMLTVIFYFITGTFRGIIRHAGLSDIHKILVATVGPVALCWIVNVVNYQFHPPIIHNGYLLSYRESLMLYAILAVLLIASRLFIQHFYNHYFRSRRSNANVVIYGAGAAGVLAYNALQQDSSQKYKVIAFIDDNSSKVNQQLNGIPIFREQTVLTPRFVRHKKVQQLLIAMPSIRVSHKQLITTKALDLGLSVRSVPHASSWLDGSFSVSQIQEVRIEDLLERDTVSHDSANILRQHSGQTILVTGAAGVIGSELSRQLMQYSPAKVVMLDRSEAQLFSLRLEMRSAFPSLVDSMEFIVADIDSKPQMEHLFSRLHPQLVYHAAAYKQVALMEGNPYEALRTNLFSTIHLADMAVRFGVQKFVTVSSDKAVNPTSVLGATKRLAERYLMSRPAAPTAFITIRFGNILDSCDTVISRFKKQIETGGPLAITQRDMVRFFIGLPEACNLTLEACAMGEGGDIMVFDMGKPIRVYDLATKMIQLSGRRDIEIKEIGLRQGEKLCEEMISSKEGTLPTAHYKIMRVQGPAVATATVDADIAALEEAMSTMDDMQIVARIKAVLPEYISNNSVYCALDAPAAN